MLTNNHNIMLFKIFKQKGKEVLINVENIVSVKADETTGKIIINSVSESNEVDGSLEEIKSILGLGPKKEVRGF
jgi:hypothetical protein